MKYEKLNALLDADHARHVQQIHTLAHRVGELGDYACDLLMYGRDTPAIREALDALRDLEIKLLESLES